MNNPADSVSSPPPGYVIDASVGIKLFLDDPLSNRAYQLFKLLTTSSPIELYVPDLFFIECTNVLWKYVRWAGLELEVARSDLEDLSRLDLNVTSTADLMVEALEFAAKVSITAYDACYIALAKRLDLPFVTTDEKLLGVNPSVRWLGDLEMPSEG